MIEKLKTQSTPITQKQLETLHEIFPSAVTQVGEGETLRYAVDFEALKRDLCGANTEKTHGTDAEKACKSDTGRELCGADTERERFRMTWPGKSKAIEEANSPVRAVLCPVREKSVDFDRTRNLYIEGDNLDVLKLLRKTHLGKIKMIYIDPPYNTGTDFVYSDRFARRGGSFFEGRGASNDPLHSRSDNGNRLHANWMNMLYPRLMLARELLTEDGAIFISIDDNELAHLIAMGDELFSAHNRLPIFSRVTKKSGNNGDNFSPCVDYVVIYAKNIDKLKEFRVNLDDEIVKRYRKTDEYFEERGPYQEVGLFQSALKHGGSSYPILCPDGTRVLPPNGQPWRWNRERFSNGLKEGRIVFKKTSSSPLLDAETGERARWNVYTKVYLKERQMRGLHPKNFSDAYQNTLATTELSKLGIPFDFAKPVALVSFFVKLLTEKEDIVLDFFSGSATTAHAVMQCNAEDGGARQFIMVQIPEPCNGKSKAFKAGYATICEIGEERIRRAGRKILLNTPNSTLNTPNSTLNTPNSPLDVGFRVWKAEASEGRGGTCRP